MYLLSFFSGFDTAGSISSSFQEQGKEEKIHDSFSQL